MDISDLIEALEAWAAQVRKENTRQLPQSPGQYHPAVDVTRVKYAESLVKRVEAIVEPYKDALPSSSSSSSSSSA